jgi:hypothetical protein
MEPAAHADTCPGCAARIPPSRPTFCEYCGATLPSPGVSSPDAATAEVERRLAALRAADESAPRRSGSWTALVVTLLVVAAVLALGFCSLVSVRTVPGG